MGQYVFPVEFLFWTKNQAHAQHKQLLLSEIRNNLALTKDMQKGKWFCDVNTEFFACERGIEKYLPLVSEAIYPALDEMFEGIPNLARPTKSKVTKIWYNHYEPKVDNGQEVHMHDSSGYSGIYFLELSEPNTSVFYSHLASMNHTAASPSFKADFAQEGDILLFPSSLLHYVLPSTCPRTTVAFNIKCDYEART